jgi:hypothetical protein
MRNSDWSGIESDSLLAISTPQRGYHAALLHEPSANLNQRQTRSSGSPTPTTQVSGGRPRGARRLVCRMAQAASDTPAAPFLRNGSNKGSLVDKTHCKSSEREARRPGVRRTATTTAAKSVLVRPKSKTERRVTLLTFGDAMKRKTAQKHNEFSGNLGDARRILPNHSGMVQDELRKARRGSRILTTRTKAERA